MAYLLKALQTLLRSGCVLALPIAACHGDHHRRVWPDTFVTDDVLTRAISELRRVFGDDAKEPRFIQTILKSGNRLIARVSPDDTEQRVATLGQKARIGSAGEGDGGVVAPFPTGRASAHVQTLWRARTLGCP